MTVKERDVRVWWSHIHTIIEVKAKPESAKKLHTHIVQLCKYMRQMFCEQLDRRFIMGLLLCGDELTMWLCDRTGLIGTIEPVNIYEQRGRFIQILAAFSMLSPNRIGWDESMKLYQPKTKEHLESYLVPLDHKKSLHQLNWVISMPFENDPKAREEFVTIRAIMAAPAQIIYSRATIVWEVVRLRDIEEKKLEPEVLVLKQIWQLIEEDSESEGLHEALMYEAAGFKSDRLYSQEFVSTPDGLIDSTERNRRNSKVMTYSNAAKELEGKQGETPAQSTAGKKRPRDENEEPYCYIRIAAEVRNNIFKTKGNKILARALARMLMKKGGYPLKDFIDDLELLRAVRDAVKDHQDMYERGVLHRDISMGNILLCDDGTKCTGMLIDLDNAKRTQQKIHFPARETPPGIVLLVELFEYNMDPEIWEGAARYIERLDDLLAYLSHLWKKRPPYLQQITTKNLNWSPDVSFIYSTHCATFLTALVSKRRTRFPSTRGKRRFPAHGLFMNLIYVERIVTVIHFQGTEPFLSVEISMKKRLRDEDTGPPIHNAVHDMESFLWVLLYIAITRTGTGMRRPEFNLDPDSDNDLRDIAKELFESGVSRKARCLFQHEELEIVLKYIHPDFENFKDLFRKWRWSVLNGHLFKAVEHYNIHKIVLNILDETITLVKRKEDDKYATELKKKKDEPRTTWNRRRKCWAPRTNDGNRRQTTRKPDSEEQLLDENDVEDYEIKYYDGYSPQGKAQGRVPKPQSEAESPARGPMLKKPKFE
ncbi:hypothetical protein AX15_004649 [Amanita polypyramis BW_CC]|nr:hypothetical protein AX15_004649 [Amanita polypyramis BW_CC]